MWLCCAITYTYIPATNIWMDLCTSIYTAAVNNYILMTLTLLQIWTKKNILIS